MLKKFSPLSLITLLTVTIFLSGCSGGDGNKGAPLANYRISRQDSLKPDRSIRNYWLYSYNSNGYITTIKYYDASNELINTAYLTYQNGLRSEEITKDLGNNIISSRMYTYDKDGFLAKVTYYREGKADSYNTYTFNNGKKLTTFKYSLDNKLNSKREFS